MDLSILSIFKNRNFSKLFLANLISQVGNFTGMTAFVFYLLEYFSDKPKYVTITELMYSLPTLVVFLLVGVISDRMDRQKIAEHSDWIRALLTIILLISIISDVLWLIFTVLFIRSAVAKFFTPAQVSLTQGILNQDEYTTAAGLNQMLRSVFMLFGNTLGAVSYWIVGVEGAVIIDGISFIISALIIRSCKIDKSVRLPNGVTKWGDLNIRLVITDFKNVLTYIWSHRLLLILIMGTLILGLVNGGLSVMPVFLLKYKLVPKTYEEMTALMGIVMGAGVLIGSFIASFLCKKFKLHQLIIGGFFINSILLIMSGIVPNVTFFMVVTFFLGLTFPIVNVAYFGWLPHIVDPQKMGRVQGLMDPIIMLSRSAALFLISITYPSLISIEALFYFMGILVLVTAFYYLFTLPFIVRSQKVGESSALSK